MLSFQKIFQKRKRPVTEPGKGDYWYLDLNAPEGLKRPRKRNKDTRRESPVDAEDYDGSEASDLSDSASPELGGGGMMPMAGPSRHGGDAQHTFSSMTRRGREHSASSPPQPQHHPSFGQSGFPRREGSGLSNTSAAAPPQFSSSGGYSTFGDQLPAGRFHSGSGQSSSSGGYTHYPSTSETTRRRTH